MSEPTNTLPPPPGPAGSYRPLEARETEQLLTGLIESAMDGIVAIDDQQRVVLFNPAAERIFGVSAAEVLGDPLDRLLPDGLGERHATHVRAFARSGARRLGLVGLGRIRGRRAGGELFPIDASVSKVEVNGRVLFTVILRDITERARAEAALRHERAFLRTVIDAVPSLIFVKDREGRFVLANEALARCYGTTPGGVVSRSDADFNPDADEVGHFRHDDREVLETRQAKVIPEEKVTCADGHSRWLSTVKVPLIEADGSCDKVLGVATDITGLKRADAALRESEGRWRELAEAMPHLVWTCLPDGRCDYISRQWLEYTGRTEAEQLGWGWFEQVHPDDRETIAATWAQAVATGGPYDVQFRVRHRSGAYRWFKVRGVPARDQSGHIVKWYGSDTDIHELREAQEALREAARRKDEFLAMLAHELRNPLVPIRNAAHIMGLLDQAEPRLRWVRETIERQVGYLTRLVDDLLDVSRIVGGKIALKREEVDLAACISQALETVRPLIEARGHRLEVRLPDHPVRLEGDPVRIAQMLLNLLDNAAKYTPEGGRIWLEGEAIDGELVLRVRDSGVGIPTDFLPRIFNLFEQADRTLDRAQGGLGIGLTLVRRLAEEHGGRIEASSPGVGFGSTFTLHLPLRRPAFATPEREMPVEERSPGARVLVVDDDRAVADSTALLLELEGYQVRTAYSGETALSQARVFRPDVVLLDIALKDVAGYEVARRLRQLPDGERLCLVAITGYGHADSRTLAVEAGFDHYLVKPVQPDQLTAVFPACEAQRRGQST